MAKELFIYGYISTFSEYDQENSNVLKTFNYDEKKSKFTNIFTDVKHGYGFASSIIGFSMSFDAVTTNSRYWIERFEELLGKLHAFSATVEIQCFDYPEEEGSFYYVLTPSGENKQNKIMSKCEFDQTGNLVKEEEIELKHE